MENRVNKSVFSFLRTLTTWHYTHSPAVLLRTGSNLSAGRTHSSKPAAAALLLWFHAGTDRRTDTVPFHRPCFAYYAGSANNQGITPVFLQN